MDEARQREVTGRFAPSPTGELHLGNLRTALVAWLSARSQGGRFIVRMEDLDRLTSSQQCADNQLAALRWLGLDWDGPVVRQSQRFARYDRAIDELEGNDLTYPCFCTRKEIAAAATAPNGGAERPYPGTCRRLSAAARLAREASGRHPALRLAATRPTGEFVDVVHGPYSGWIDDVVLRRNDGVAAYNLAVVVDDEAQGITEIVRGDDLLSSTPRQILLGELLGMSKQRYMHVPLVLGHDGHRLAKRHGDVTAAAMSRAGTSPSQLVGLLAHSLGLTSASTPISAVDLLSSFDPATIIRTPWTFDDERRSSDAHL